MGGLSLTFKGRYAGHKPPIAPYVLIVAFSSDIPPEHQGGRNRSPASRWGQTWMLS